MTSERKICVKQRINIVLSCKNRLPSDVTALQTLEIPMKLRSNPLKPVYLLYFPNILQAKLNSGTTSRLILGSLWRVVMEGQKLGTGTSLSFGSLLVPRWMYNDYQNSLYQGNSVPTWEAEFSSIGPELLKIMFHLNFVIEDMARNEKIGLPILTWRDAAKFPSFWPKGYSLFDKGLVYHDGWRSSSPATGWWRSPYVHSSLPSAR